MEHNSLGSTAAARRPSFLPLALVSSDIPQDYDLCGHPAALSDDGGGGGDDGTNTITTPFPAQPQNTASWLPAVPNPGSNLYFPLNSASELTHPPDRHFHHHDSSGSTTAFSNLGQKLELGTMNILPASQLSPIYPLGNELEAGHFHTNPAFVISRCLPNSEEGIVEPIASGTTNSTIAAQVPAAASVQATGWAMKSSPFTYPEHSALMGQALAPQLLPHVGAVITETVPGHDPCNTGSFPPNTQESFQSASSEKPALHDYSGSKRIPHSVIERRYRQGLQTGMQRLRESIPTLRNESTTHSACQHRRRASCRKGECGAGKTSKLAILDSAVDYLHELENQIKRLQNENRQIRQIAEIHGLRLDFGADYSATHSKSAMMISPKTDMSNSGGNWATVSDVPVEENTRPPGGSSGCPLVPGTAVALISSPFSDETNGSVRHRSQHSAGLLLGPSSPAIPAVDSTGPSMEAGVHERMLIVPPTSGTFSEPCMPASEGKKHSSSPIGNVQTTPKSISSQTNSFQRHRAVLAVPPSSSPPPCVRTRLNESLGM